MRLGHRVLCMVVHVVVRHTRNSWRTTWQSTTPGPCGLYVVVFMAACHVIFVFIKNCVVRFGCARPVSSLFGLARRVY